MAENEALNLLCNIASIDVYEFRNKKISLLSNNPIFDMRELVKDALKLGVPEKLNIFNIHNFYAVIVPVTDQNQLIIVPHANAANISHTYQQITTFINNMKSLSQLVFLLITGKTAPNWKVHVKQIETIPPQSDFEGSISLQKRIDNEEMLFKAIQDLDYEKFKQLLNAPTVTGYLGKVFEKNGHGKKDVIIRFTTLLINSLIKTKQAPVAAIFKLEDDILGKVAFKKDPPPIAIWKKQIATQCFFEFKQLIQENSLSPAQKCAIYIKNNITRKLNLSIIAAALNHSSSSLSRQFKQEYQITVSAYINQQKIQAAQYMLRNTSITVSEIAYTLAFNNPNYFMKLFKKIVGVTAKEYRKNYACKVTAADRSHTEHQNFNSL